MRVVSTPLAISMIGGILAGCGGGEDGKRSTAVVGHVHNGKGPMVVHTTIGRKDAERAALASCGFPKNADPSLISFTDELTYDLGEESGATYEHIVVDVDAYFFECPMPGKDA